MIAGSTAADDPKRPVFLGQMLPELFDVLGVLVVPLSPLRARKDELPRLVEDCSSERPRSSANRSPA